MTTPADEITAAAEKLRVLAAEATPGPWQQSGIGDYGWTVNTPDRHVAETDDSDTGRADADWIATKHPGVGRAHAKWLWSWVGIDLRDDAALPEDAQHALAVARAINGTA